MSTTHIIGWDVGGAHLKAVLLDGEGNLLQVLQVPCALWRGLNELEAGIADILNKFSVSTAMHAITMTGELVDLFANRQAGVREISYVMHTQLVGTKLFYTGALTSDCTGFVNIDKVQTNWQHIASANWLASAAFVSKQVKHGILIDIGSTTTDFILIENSQPVCIGFTDAARMQSEELVYTGVIRTPLMAISQKIEFGNTVTSVAAEYFATTADVYRLMGKLEAEDDMADTADGKEKTVHASAARIARMIGHDVGDASLDDWTKLANSFKHAQVSRLQDVVKKHLSRLNNNSKVRVIIAGTGSFLAREIAENMNLQYLDVASLIDNLPTLEKGELEHWASVCLPAYSVAYLAFHKN